MIIDHPYTLDGFRQALDHIAVEIVFDLRRDAYLWRHAGADRWTRMTDRAFA